LQLASLQLASLHSYGRVEQHASTDQLSTIHCQLELALIVTRSTGSASAVVTWFVTRSTGSASAVVTWFVTRSTGSASAVVTWATSH